MRLLNVDSLVSRVKYLSEKLYSVSSCYNKNDSFLYKYFTQSLASIDSNKLNVDSVVDMVVQLWYVRKSMLRLDKCRINIICLINICRNLHIII